jgi:hypothetical protein
MLDEWHRLALYWYRLGYGISFGLTWHGTVWSESGIPWYHISNIWLGDSSIMEQNYSYGAMMGISS